MTLQKNHVSPIFKKLKILSPLGFNVSSSAEAEAFGANPTGASPDGVTPALSKSSLYSRSDELQSTLINSDNISKTENQSSSFEESSQKFKDSLELETKKVSNSSTTSNLTGYSKIQELKLVKIGIASSEQIMSWAEKTLPNGKVFGEVLNANTLHYKTFKPQKGGLFCQRIFGPLKDFECACGIVRKPSSEEGLVQSLLQTRKPKRTYCQVCDVEYTWSVIRRYQLGYIKLASPVTHLWYLKANPSYLSMLLDLRKKELEDIIYCMQITTLEDYWRPRGALQLDLNPNLFFESYKKYLSDNSYNSTEHNSFSKYKQLSRSQKQKETRQSFKVFRHPISYLYSITKDWQKNVTLSNKHLRSFTSSNSLNVHLDESLPSTSLFGDLLNRTPSSNTIETSRPGVRGTDDIVWTENSSRPKQNKPNFGSGSGSGPSSREQIKRAQIQSLETAYQLSSDNFDPRKFARLKGIAKILTTKKVIDTKTSFFYAARNSCVENFYRNYYKNFSKESWFSFQKLNPQVLEKKFLGFQKLKNNEEIPIHSFPPNQSLKKVLRNSFHHLKQSRKNSKITNSQDSQLASQSKKRLRWGTGNNYSYVKKQFLNNSLTMENSTKKLSTAESYKENDFLPFFLNLILKSNVINSSDSQFSSTYDSKKNTFDNGVQFRTTSVSTGAEPRPEPMKQQVNSDCWESIYDYQIEALTFFTGSKRISINQHLKKSGLGINRKTETFLSKLSLPSITDIFSNCMIMYLLVILQTTGKQNFMSTFLFHRKQVLVQALLFNELIKHKHVSSLRKKLQDNILDSFELDNVEFIETEDVSRHSNLKHFTSLGFSFILKMYLMGQIFKMQCFYKEKNFRIFLYPGNKKSQFFLRQSQKKTNQERLNFTNSDKRSLWPFSSSPYPDLSLTHKKFNFNKQGLAFYNFREGDITEKYIQTLLKTKKICHFIKNNESYPKDSISYLKNFFNIRKNLENLKHKKCSTAFQLFNNIYTVSYSEGWQTEKDWKYFLYYTKASLEVSDQIICGYESRFSQAFHQSSGSAAAEPRLNATTSPVSSLPLGKRMIQTNRSASPIVGAHILQKLLYQYEGQELKKMAKQHQNVLPKFNRYIRYRKQTAIKKSDKTEVQRLLQLRDDFIRRLKLLRKLFKKNTKTSSMILTTVPVLPPDLRPILKMQNQIAASDLNRFYQRILYRNDRLKKFIRANTAMMNAEPAFEVQYAQRLLQEAVDNLIQNGKGQVKPETNSRGQPLKSLSEILKGKQGRFRQYLLGKRVDYSGRSVIVVGPTLNIYECGLPFEMAMELFLPFLIKRIFQYRFARTVMGAKTILKNDRKTTWHLLEEIMQHHPILLNRAPTLHRLGIQAFRPKLIDGRAILLHPLVCPAFNADFDGDQMAVHVPITVEARTEAWKLMFSRNHLISPATGEPMLLPTQDMVLGCYYLTTTAFRESNHTQNDRDFHKAQATRHNFNYPFNLAVNFYFSNMKQVLQAYLHNQIHLQTPIWMRWNGQIQLEQSLSQPLEIRVNPDGSWTEIQPEFHRTCSPSGQWYNFFVRTTAGRILFNLMVQDCIEKKI